MVSIWPPTSKSTRRFNNPFVTVVKAPITIGIIVTSMFHGFFQFSSKVEIIIIIITHLIIFHTSVSLEFEWQQISSSLQDSSHYSGWS